MIIRGLVGMLQNQMSALSGTDSALLKKNQSIMAMIDESTGKMLSIIQDLLLVGELEKGTVQKKTSALKQFVESTIKLWNVNAAEKNIMIDFHCDEDVYAPINQERMGRILDNLISNAIKFRTSRVT